MNLQVLFVAVLSAALGGGWAQQGEKQNKKKSGGFRCFLTVRRSLQVLMLCTVYRKDANR